MPAQASLACELCTADFMLPPELQEQLNAAIDNAAKDR
jgi:hypothetical protein